MKDKILLLIIALLLIMLYSIYNCKLTLAVNNYYINETTCYKNSHKINIKFGEYWLFGKVNVD